MTWAAFALVLLSATLDASWNLLAKKERMTVPLYATALASNAFLFSWYLAFSPVPLASLPATFWKPCALAVAGAVLFALALPLAYRFLDMTTAYPMIRALPILFVAGATSAFGIGKPLSGAAKVGMALVFAGCLLVPLETFGDFRPGRFLRRGFPFVLLVAAGTTVYTIFDSEAVAALRALEAKPGSHSAASLAYYEIRALLVVLGMWGCIFVSPNLRAEAAVVLRTRLKSAVTIGLGSSLAYMAILAAMPLAGNVAYIHAFRQIGLAIGLLGGVLVLHERVTVPKVAGVTLILGGLAASVI